MDFGAVWASWGVGFGRSPRQNKSIRGTRPRLSQTGASKHLYFLTTKPKPEPKPTSQAGSQAKPRPKPKPTPKPKCCCCPQIVFSLSTIASSDACSRSASDLFNVHRSDFHDTWCWLPIHVCLDLTELNFRRLCGE